MGVAVGATQQSNDSLAVIIMRNSIWFTVAVVLLSGISDLQGQTTPFDSVTATRTQGAVCYHHALYIVVERAQQEVGSDLFVRPASSGRCDANLLPGDFVWRNREAEYFLGLRGHVLFIDSGTGPDLRGVIVIDLRSRRRLLETTYVGDIVAGPDSFTVGLWQGSELAKPAPGCPRTQMIPGIDSLFWLDLRNGRLAFGKQTRCAERQ